MEEIIIEKKHIRNKQKTCKANERNNVAVRQTDKCQNKTEERNTRESASTLVSLFSTMKSLHTFKLRP